MDPDGLPYIVGKGLYTWTSKYIYISISATVFCDIYIYVYIYICIYIYIYIFLYIYTCTQKYDCITAILYIIEVLGQYFTYFWGSRIYIYIYTYSPIFQYFGGPGIYICSGAVVHLRAPYSCECSGLPGSFLDAELGS